MSININETDLKYYVGEVKKLNADRRLYAHVITLGCQQNEADSEKIRAMAKEMGYEITEDADAADLVVVNTCAIREHAELKALSIVGNFKGLKALKPELVVAVCGCMANEEHRAEKIKKSYHHVSFTLEPAMIYKFPEMVYKTIIQRKRSFVYGKDDGEYYEGIGSVRQSGHRAWVSIMNGCNNFCSYCIVPYVRGRERSRNSGDVISECRDLVSKGYKEITLLGQNVNSYKSDLTFAELLEKIALIEGDFVLRFMTSHPKDVSDQLINVIGKYSPKIAPAFHLPLQSGSDKILKQMNRTYDTEKYLKTVNKLREAIADIAITSDIIVGFPGETEEDFLDTMKMLKTVKFDMVYSFIYSPREGTKAANMPNRISEEENKDRMARLLEFQCDMSHQINEKYVGTVQRVLVDSFEIKNGERIYNARTLTNKLVHFTGADVEIGSFINVKINKAGAFDLFAEII